MMSTKSSSMRWLLAVVVAVALLTQSAPAAEAEKTSWRDPAHDMWTAVARPAHANGDMRKIHVNHADHAVIVRVGFRNLRRTGAMLGLFGVVRTDTGFRNVFSFSVGPDGGTGSWNDGRLQLDDSRSCDPRQQVGRSFIDFRLDVIELKIPRSCLRRPEWVKVRLHSQHMIPRPWRTFSDDGLSGHASSDRWTHRIHHD